MLDKTADNCQFYTIIWPLIRAVVRRGQGDSYFSGGICAAERLGRHHLNIIESIFHGRPD